MTVCQPRYVGPVRTPRLIVVNGPPGIGKSTVARRFAAQTPLTLCLDLDDVRATLGQWESDPLTGGRRGRAMALAMIHVNLGAGHDVVVPQYLAKADFVDQLEKVATRKTPRFTSCCSPPTGRRWRPGSRRPDDRSCPGSPSVTCTTTSPLSPRPGRGSAVSSPPRANLTGSSEPYPIAPDQLRVPGSPS
jgi:predicted kinase